MHTCGAFCYPLSLCRWFYFCSWAQGAAAGSGRRDTSEQPPAVAVGALAPARLRVSKRLSLSLMKAEITNRILSHS